MLLVRDSSDDTATRYRLDGPGIESRLGEISASVQTGSETHPASYTMGTWYRDVVLTTHPI